ncbi:hypothetical protein JCM10213_003336 [Rhodosporidiobolus nylandii]
MATTEIHRVDSEKQPGTALAPTADANRLADLGYEQELRRGWSMLESFGVSFSIISICTGITTSFMLGLTNGGPGVMSIGWICVSAMTMTVALSMAEIVSAVPTSGGPYHWAALLARRRYSRFAAWATGYFNLLGQAAVTTGIVFGNAGLIATLGALRGFEVTPARTVGIHAGLLVFAGLVNTFGIKLLGHLNRLSILLHSVGIFALAVAVLAKAPTHRSAKEVFATFYDGTGVDGAEGWSLRASPAYVALTGLLLTSFTITGFDASAHMAEETRDAGRAAPIGVLTSIAASAVFGFFYLVSLLFSIQDFDRTLNSDVGQPVLQILVDVFGRDGATVAFTLIILCVTLCGTFSITSNSRMYFAFSRDGALPAFFDHVDKRNAVPVRTVWLAVLLAFILALPSLGSSVAFTAVTSIATIGLYVSYAIPIAFLAFDRSRFESMRGPFYLGRASRPIAIVAVGYVVFISVVFCLPTAAPIDSQTLNYCPVAVGIVLLYIFASWFLSARKWFTGPRMGAPATDGASIAAEKVSSNVTGEKDDKTDM